MKTPEAFAGEITNIIASDLGSFHTIPDAQKFKAKLVNAIKERDFELMTSTNDAIGGTSN